MTFRCTTCGEEHDGFPAWGSALPEVARAIPEAERTRRVTIENDVCTVDGARHFALGNINIPIHDSEDVFRFVAWVEISAEDAEFFAYMFDADLRSHFEPLQGTLQSKLPSLESELGGRVLLQLTDGFRRAEIQGASEGNSISVLLSGGISLEQACALHHQCMQKIGGAIAGGS